MSDIDALFISLLADAERLLCQRVASLEADVDAYRLLAQQCLHALHDLTVKRGCPRCQQRFQQLLGDRQQRAARDVA